MLQLKRRFIRDKSATSAYIAKIEAKRKIARKVGVTLCVCVTVETRPHPLQENVRRQRAARDSKVVMYRQYRSGELPDVQIKHSELIRPLQALSQVSGCG